MGTRKIEIEVPKGKRAEWVGNVLTLVDDKPKDITERVKTFEDACNVLGKNHPLICQYNNIDDVDSNLNAYLKLRIIVAALNEGWTPKFTVDECRYYPWFWIYKKDEYDNISDEGKNECVRFGGIAYNGASAGLAYAISYYAPSNAYANVGSRLCLKSNTLAEYCGKQFKELWFDFYVGKEFRR